MPHPWPCQTGTAGAGQGKKTTRLAATILLLASVQAVALEPLKDRANVAFLGITFIDTSTEGDYFGREDEAQRTRMLREMVAERFAAEGIDLVDLGPVEEELARTSNPAECCGCDLRMAEKLEADYVLVGEVQKVSNLIPSMNLVMRQVERQAAVRALAVHIRSNTDQSWERGMRYILDRHFFAE